MALESDGRIFRSGEAKTLYVSIPSDVVEDSAFPFDEDDVVTVQIEGDEIRIKPSEDEDHEDHEDHEGHGSNR